MSPDLRLLAVFDVLDQQCRPQGRPHPRQRRPGVRSRSRSELPYRSQAAHPAVGLGRCGAEPSASWPPYAGPGTRRPTSWATLLSDREIAALVRRADLLLSRRGCRGPAANGPRSRGHRSDAGSTSLTASCGCRPDRVTPCRLGAPRPVPSASAVIGRLPPLQAFDTATTSSWCRSARPPARRGCTSAASLPYDATHIGHANTYVAFDLLNRIWRDRGLEVDYVQNVTDIDDPLLERAAATGVDWAAARRAADRAVPGGHGGAERAAARALRRSGRVDAADRGSDRAPAATRRRGLSGRRQRVRGPLLRPGE